MRILWTQHAVAMVVRLDAVAPNTIVTLELHDGDTARGRFRGRDEGLAILAIDGEALGVPVHAISAIEVDAFADGLIPQPAEA